LDSQIGVDADLLSFIDRKWPKLHSGLCLQAGFRRFLTPRSFTLVGEQDVRNLTVLIVVSVASVGLCADPKVPKADKALNGWWKPDSAVMAGKELPREELKPRYLAISNGKYMLNQGDQVEEGTYKIDESENPKTISFVVTKGETKGKTILGIYELDKASLRICFDTSGKTRPTKFESKSDSQSFLASYHRLPSRNRLRPQGAGGTGQ
jgi:uncharacterized protein (TIGR03067 family)